MAAVQGAGRHRDHVMIWEKEGFWKVVKITKT